jgi:hypothetical protein
MGSFCIINTFMKSFRQFIKEVNVTPGTRTAMDKFGSNSTFKKIASPKIGKSSIPRFKGRRPQ